MNIYVVDGQGGGIGKALIDGIRAKLPDIYIMALGVNSLSTAAMLKGGASAGATGENAIVYNCFQACEADMIVGAIGIVCANSMHGELTEKMAAAIASSRAKKVLMPFNKCHVFVSGVKEDPLQNQIECAVQTVLNII